MPRPAAMEAGHALQPEHVDRRAGRWPSVREAAMSGVYEGLTVVELADRRNQWAGKLLADGGARVIQIEPLGGSPGRWCGPFVDDKVDPDRCLDYWWYNTGKQSVALDIARQPARTCCGDCWPAPTSSSRARRRARCAAYGLDYGSVSSQRGAHLRVADRLRPGRPVARSTR